MEGAEEAGKQYLLGGLRAFPCDSLGVLPAWFLHSMEATGPVTTEAQDLTHFQVKPPAASSPQICLQKQWCSNFLLPSFATGKP